MVLERIGLRGMHMARKGHGIYEECVELNGISPEAFVKLPSRELNPFYGGRAKLHFGLGGNSRYEASYVLDRLTFPSVESFIHLAGMDASFDEFEDVVHKLIPSERSSRTMPEDIRIKSDVFMYTFINWPDMKDLLYTQELVEHASGQGFSGMKLDTRFLNTPKDLREKFLKSLVVNPR